MCDYFILTVRVHAQTIQRPGLRQCVTCHQIRSANIGLMLLLLHKNLHASSTAVARTAEHLQLLQWHCKRQNIVSF